VRSAGGRLSVHQSANGGALFEIVLRMPDAGERTAPVDHGATVSS
jgi:hypothetical protein